MKLNLSGWKKIAEHPEHTILKNSAGHELKIAHKGLHPAQRGQMAALPMMADGGAVSNQVSEPNKKNAQDMQSGATQSGWQPDKWKANAKSALGLAKGGEVVNNPKLQQSKSQPPIPQNAPRYAAGGEAYSPPPQFSNPTQPNKPPKPHYAEGTPDGLIEDAAPSAVTAAPQAEAPSAVAPETQQQRELYNHLVSTPTGRGFQANASKAFGPDGEAPKQFDASAWQEAKAKFAEEQQVKSQNDQKSAIATQQENVARQSAGLTPLPIQVAQAATQADPKLQAQVAQETAPKGPTDPYGTQAYSDAYIKGLNEQKKGLGLEAQAQGQLGQEQQQTLQNQTSQKQKTLQDYQTHYQNLDNERQSLISDINQKHIDPQHYLSSMGTGSRIATAIGLIASGLGSGMSGQQNLAVDFLNKQISNDIEAQKVNLGKTESLLSANMRQFGNIRDATDMTKIMQSDIVSNQLKAEAAKAMDPMAKARQLQAAGALDQASAPILSQMAMRKTLLSGMQAGHIPPEQVIRAIVPEKQQDAANKELQIAQNMTKSRDNLLSAFDQLTRLDTVGNRAMSPFQTPKQVNAIKEPLLAQLVKDSEGRITPQDTKMIEAFFPAYGDSAETQNIKRAQMNKFVSEKMNFPILKGIGIDVNTTQSRYSPSGQSRIPHSPPNIR